MVRRLQFGLVMWLGLAPCGRAQQPKVEDMGAKFSTTVYETIFGTTKVMRDGLKGEVFLLEPETFQLPNFKKLKPVGVVYTTSLNIPTRDFAEGFPGVTTRNEWFAIDYTGRFFIQKAGRYEFSLVSDDGSKLYIDGSMVIDNDGHHPTVRETGSKKLSAGVHTIRVSYFQGPRWAIALMLGVRGPGEKQWRFFNTDDFKLPDDFQESGGKNGQR